MIRNLILDMGGVILSVDYKNIISEFSRYGIDASTMYTQKAQMPFIDKFEVGEITPAQFRDEVRKVTNKNLSDNEIDHIWNSMIISLKKDVIHLLGEIKPKYDKLLLFSNTNAIHMEHIRKDFEHEVGFDIFTLLFDKAYFSNEIHHRKPNKDAFLYVLNDAGVKAEETLFIDDTKMHIDGAKLVGLHTHLLLPDENLKQCIISNT